MSFFNESAGNADDDQPLSFAEAAKLVPGRPHLSTLHRWRLRGIRGIRLTTCMIGGRRMVTRRQLREFFVSISGIGGSTTAAAQGGLAPTFAARTCRQREAAIKRAESDLDQAGI